MRLHRKLLWLSVTIVALGLAMGVATHTTEAKFRTLVLAAFDDLEWGAEAVVPASYSPDDLATLPSAVRKYLEQAMPAAGPRTTRVSMRQKGRIRIVEEGSWRELEAEQRISANPPQMVWAGRSMYGPWMPLVTLIRLRSGQGSVQSWLWSRLPIIDRGSYSITSYLMLRWLGEAVWYPDALLPSESLSWEQVASRHPELVETRVTLKGPLQEVSGLFVFHSASTAPMRFTAEDTGDPELDLNRFYCKYSDWRRFGEHQLPATIVEGTRQGPFDEDRLEVSLVDLEQE